MQHLSKAWRPPTFARYIAVMTHTQTSRGRRTSATLRGASSLGIGGTGRVNRLVNAVLKDNGWARDAQNIRSDFNRAMQKVQRSLPR